MLLFRVIIWVLSVLPAGIVFSAFSLFGRIFFFCAVKKRLTAYKNLKIAFPDIDFKTAHRIAKISCIKFGYNIAETFRLPVLTKAYVRKHLSVVGEELLREKDSAVIVGIHEGSWEMLNASLAAFIPYAILAQQQRHLTLDYFLNKLRVEQGLSVIDSSNLRELVEYFRKGFWVGFAVDGGYEENALTVPFFTRTVPTPSGAVRFAKKFNKDIVCGYVQRIRGQYHGLTLKKVSGVARKDTRAILEEINHIYEDFIREEPTEYGWFYKRFKYAPQRDVVILDDGRPGHLNQSLSLYEMMAQARPELAFRKKLVPVRFKNTFCRMIAQVSALWASGYCSGCAACLRYLLTGDSFRQAATGNADVVISTGSYLAGVNVILARAHQAVPLSVFGSAVPAAKFHTVFSPRHDQRKGKNVVQFEGALSFKDPLVFQQEADHFVEQCVRTPLKGFYAIGVLIGGNTKDASCDVDAVKQYLEKIAEYAAAHTGSVRLLLSTSRRTPEAIESVIEGLFADKEYVGSLIIANKKNYPWVLSGMLACSAAMVVSNDSISMISEAASRVPTLIINSVASVRHCTFAEYLATHKHALLARSPAEISSLLTNLKSGTIPLVKLDNQQIIAEHFRTKVSL